MFSSISVGDETRDAACGVNVDVDEFVAVRMADYL